MRVTSPSAPMRSSAIRQSTLQDRAADRRTRIWTGGSAVVVAVLTVAEFVVQMTVGPRPDLWQSTRLVSFMTAQFGATLAIVVVDTVLMLFLVVFLAGFRQLVTRTRSDLQWLADLVYGAGLAFVVVTLVGDSLEGGAALDAGGPHPDAVVLRALTEAHELLFGVTACLLTALLLGVAGYVSRLSRIVPAWTATMAYVVAGLNVAAGATVFIRPTDSTAFAVAGVSVTALATFPWLAWVATVGVLILRGRDRADASPRRDTCSRRGRRCARPSNV